MKLFVMLVLAVLGALWVIAYRAEQDFYVHLEGAKNGAGRVC